MFFQGLRDIFVSQLRNLGNKTLQAVEEIVFVYGYILQLRNFGLSRNTWKSNSDFFKKYFMY